MSRPRQVMLQPCLIKHLLVLSTDPRPTANSTEAATKSYRKYNQAEVTGRQRWAPTTAWKLNRNISWCNDKNFWIKPSQMARAWCKAVKAYTIKGKLTGKTPPRWLNKTVVLWLLELNTNKTSVTWIPRGMRGNNEVVSNSNSNKICKCKTKISDT